MRIRDFKLERYFAKHEFNSPYLLCCSDCESLTIQELFQLAPEAKQDLLDLNLCYTESLGHPALRREISKLYDDVTPDQVLVFSGAEEAIFAFMNVFLEDGDHAAVQFPAYQSLFEIADSLRATVSRIELKFEDSWEFSLKRLEREITYRTKLLVINFPHNPTGSFPDLETYQQISRLAQDKGIFIFSDEVYKFLELGDRAPLPSMVDINPASASLNVMSKSFGLAGLRIGWLVCKDSELLARVAAFKDYTTICNSGPSEILAIHALRKKVKLINRNKKIIAENLRLLEEFMDDFAHKFMWVKPEAGPITLIKYLGREGASEFCQRLLEEKGVLLLPSSLYEIEDKFFRIGYGRKDFALGLEKLREFVQ